MRYFTLELKRSIFNKRFLISLLIVMVLITIGGFEMITEDYYDFSETLLWTFFGNSIAYIALFWTIIGCIPWVNSNCIERKTGFGALMQSKIGKLRYYSSKFVCNYIVAALTLLIPELILVLILIPLKGLTNITLESCCDTIYLFDIAINNPLLYSMIIMMTTSLATASYASIGLTVSVFIDNSVIVTIVPFVVYAITYLNVRYTSLYFISGSFIYDINDYDKPYYGIRTLMYIMYFIVFYCIYIVGSLKTNEKHQVPHTKTI